MAATVPPSASRSVGFTLVELLVALFVMALLAVMSWRGIDGMVRAQAQTQARADAVATLQTGLSQWGADLDALADLPSGALEWNGQSLRITRYAGSGAGAGLRVVAWSRRDIDGTAWWLRWQSELLRTPAAVQQAWLQAGIWAQNPDDVSRSREVAMVPLGEWKVFYFRNDAWTNPLSSTENPASGPDGVRLVLTLPQGGPLAGDLTRDWIRPTISGNKS